MEWNNYVTLFHSILSYFILFHFTTYHQFKHTHIGISNFEREQLSSYFHVTALSRDIMRVNLLRFCLISQAVVVVAVRGEAPTWTSSSRSRFGAFGLVRNTYQSCFQDQCERGSNVELINRLPRFEGDDHVMFIGADGNHSSNWWNTGVLGTWIIDMSPHKYAMTITFKVQKPITDLHITSSNFTLILRARLGRHIYLSFAYTREAVLCHYAKHGLRNPLEGLITSIFVGHHTKRNCSGRRHFLWTPPLIFSAFSHTEL